MSIPAEDQSSAESFYYPVSVTKFSVLSVLTFGLYELYWFYKNWSYIRERDGVKIWPFWRAVFSQLLSISFFLDVRRHCQGKRIPIAISILLALLYFLMASAASLPGPYWTVTLFSFLPLLPVVLQINAINNENTKVFTNNSCWKLRHILLAVCMVPLLAFALTSSYGFLPSTQVIPGSMLWGFQRDYLEENGIVDANEQVIYFYSSGLFSIQDDGNLLTDRRVVSYWCDEESGEFYVQKAGFGEITKTTTQYGSFVQDTLLTVFVDDGREFDLFLSTEARRDRLFLAELKKLRSP